MRTTRKELQEIVNHLSKLTGRPHYLQYAYGRPRVYTDWIDPHTGEIHAGAVEVSPRLPTRELAQWLYAFRAGYHAAQHDYIDSARRTGKLPPAN